jgi:hypothetical protein
MLIMRWLLARLAGAGSRIFKEGRGKLLINMGDNSLGSFVTDKDRIGFCGFRCGGTGDDEAAKGDVIAQ